MNHTSTTSNDAALLLGRVLASALFLFGGWGKLMAAAGTKAYLAKIGLPAPDIAYLVAVAVELGGGLLFLLGVRMREVALVLAIWCVATALIAHADFGDRAQMTHFLKNLGLAGGFLAFMAAGAGGYSVDGAMRRRVIA